MILSYWGGLFQFQGGKHPSHLLLPRHVVSFWILYCFLHHLPHFQLCFLDSALGITIRIAGPGIAGIPATNPGFSFTQNEHGPNSPGLLSHQNHTQIRKGPRCSSGTSLRVSAPCVDFPSSFSFGMKITG